MPKIIIPAAGFGRRMGNIEAKEMLLFDGSPLISWVFNLALKRSWKVHVISRQEKKSLNEYSQKFAEKEGLDLSLQIVDPQGEWMDTVLASEVYWSEENLLVLPDTRFGPIEIVDQMVHDLQDYTYSFALHEVSDPEKWGVIIKSGEKFYCAEKLQESGSRHAWGIIGFQKAYGRSLFSGMSQSTVQPISGRSKLHLLDFFQDLTR